MKRLVFIAAAVLTIACSPSRHGTTPRDSQPSSSGSQQDGSSYERAIVIHKKSETSGVAAEYEWIREHYPGSKNKMQALQNVRGKAYDVLTIETADGVEKEIYFDISRFFGKF